MTADKPTAASRAPPEATRWGVRLYVAMLAMIGLLATYPAYNHVRISRLEKLRADIINVGGRAPRSRGGSRSSGQIYWESLGGDLSRVVIRQVEFAPHAMLERSAIARLHRCPELARLCLEGHPLDDELCRQVFSLRQLGELRIVFCELDDRQLQGIEHMDLLTSLDLRGTRISDASVDRLSRLKWLEELDLRYTNLSPDGVQRLARALPGAKILHSPWPSADHRDAALRLFRCGAMLELPEEGDQGLIIRVRGKLWHGTPHDLADIARLQRVELLELAYHDLEPEWLDEVARLPNVPALSLRACQLRDAELPRLVRGGRIERLQLNDVFIELPQAQELAQWRGVRSLVLVNARLVPGSLAALAGLPDLEEVAIIGLRFRGTGVGELAPASGLKRLYLSRLQIGDAEVQTICHWTRLERLGLTGMAVADDAADELALLVNLRDLDLSNTKMTASGIAKVAAALPQCRVVSGIKPVEELDFWSLAEGSRPQSR